MIELFNSYTEFTADPDANAPYLLQPAECYISAVLNGEWCLYLTCYRDERGDWLQIVPDAILRVPQWQYKPMTGMFRIKTVERTDTMVTATADPIAYDAAGDCFCYDVRPTNATGIQALQAILAANNRYSCVCDISKTSTAYYIRKNALEAINGSEENSFLNRWGGEISYLNNAFSVLSRQGADNGVVVSFRRDFALDGLRYSADLTDSINTIVPLAYNGHGLSTNPPSVSTLAPPNAPVRTGVVTFENIRLSSDSGFSPGETIPSYITICANQAALDTALTQAANDYFAETNCAYPKIELECDLIALQNLEEYKGFQALETVSLGDTVHIRDGIMGLDGTPLLTARIMEIEWDCIHDRARRIVARSDDSQRSAVGGTAINVGAGSDPFYVDADGNIVMGDKLIFGNPNITVPTYLQNVYQSTNGSDLLMRPGGRLIIGGGEYASARYNAGSFEGAEAAWLGADSAVYIESNGNTIANRKKWTFSSSGDLTTPTGGLINGVDITELNPKIELTNTGTQVTITGLTSGTSWQNAASFDLPAGTFLVEIVARFASNASGRRAMNLSASSGGTYVNLLCQDNRAPVDGNYTFLHICTILSGTGATRYINLAQNSGSALDVLVRYRFTKLGDV